MGRISYLIDIIWLFALLSIHSKKHLSKIDNSTDPVKTSLSTNRIRRMEMTTKEKKRRGRYIAEHVSPSQYPRCSVAHDVCGLQLVQHTLGVEKKGGRAWRVQINTGEQCKEKDRMK